MLEVRKNQILRKLSGGGTAQLHTLERTLITTKMK